MEPNDKQLKKSAMIVILSMCYYALGRLKQGENATAYDEAHSLIGRFFIYATFANLLSECLDLYNQNRPAYLELTEWLLDDSTKHFFNSMKKMTFPIFGLSFFMIFLNNCQIAIYDDYRQNHLPKLGLNIASLVCLLAACGLSLPFFPQQTHLPEETPGQNFREDLSHLHPQ